MAGRGQTYAVDSHPQKQLIIDGILAGRSARSIASSLAPPIHFNAIQRYRTNVVKPLLATASKSTIVESTNKVNAPAIVPLSDDSQVIQQVHNSIQAAPAVSIFRRRLEKLYGTLDRTIEKAETAVRVTYDKEGNEVAIASDLSAVAPLANQIHKGLEILGRATGELEPQGASGVSIQIVCPTQPGEQPRITFARDEGLTLDAAADDEAGMQEIGVIQR